jgi:solute carrier family 31 (copper transporter), member 1
MNGMGGMTMPMGSMGSLAPMTMVPYLHITGGDYLFFESWRPYSNGAIAGACIALVVLAIFERFVGGMRSRLEAYWSRKFAPQSVLIIDCSNFCSRALIIVRDGTMSDDGSLAKDSSDSEVHVKLQRTSPPFILAHDLPRGIMHMFQVALSYALMLAVMYVLTCFISFVFIDVQVVQCCIYYFYRFGSGNR